MNSVLQLKIYLGDLDNYPRITASVPFLGIYLETDIKEARLAFATDYIYGVAAALGFLTSDGIGAISERGDFKFGGGNIHNNELTVKLRCTDNYIENLESYGISLYGKRACVFEMAQDDGENYTRHGLFAGTIQKYTYNETVLTLSVSPTTNDIYRFPLAGNAAVFGLNKYIKYMPLVPTHYLRLLTNSLSIETVDGTGHEWPIFSCYQRDTVDLDLKELPWDTQKYLIDLNGYSLSGPERIKEFISSFYSEYRVIKKYGINGIYIRVNTSQEVSRLKDIEVGTWFGKKCVAIIPEVFINMSTFATNLTLEIPNIDYTGDDWPTAPSIYGNKQVSTVINDRIVTVDISAEVSDPVDMERPNVAILPVDVSSGNPNVVMSINPITTSSTVKNRIALLTESTGDGSVHTIDDDKPLSRRYGPNISRYSRYNGMWYRYVGGKYKGVYAGYKSKRGWNLYGGQDVVNPNAAFTTYDDYMEYEEGGKSTITPDTTPWIIIPIVIRLPDLPKNLRGIGAKVYLHTRMSVYSGPKYNISLDRPIDISLDAFDDHGNHKKIYASTLTETGRADPMSRSVGYSDLLDRVGGQFLTSQYSKEFYSTTENPTVEQFMLLPNTVESKPIRRRVPGYKNYGLDGIDFDTTVKKELVITAPGISYHLYYNVFAVKIWYVGVVAMLEIDLSEGVLLTAPGRVYGDGTDPRDSVIWDGRKRASDYIDNPVDIVEHILRQYRLRDVGDTGYTYAKDAGERILRDTFDAAASNGDIMPVSRAIYGGDLDSETVISSLYRDYYLTALNNIDQNGDIYRGISYLKSNKPQARVMAWQLMQEAVIAEPSAQDIYCEPTIKYRHVEGYGYTQEMSVSRVNMPVWLPEYTKGLYDGTRSSNEVVGSNTVVIGNTEWMRQDITYTRHGANGFVALPTSGLPDATLYDYVDLRQYGYYPPGVVYSWEETQRILELFSHDGWRLPTDEDMAPLKKMLNPMSGANDIYGLNINPNAWAYGPGWQWYSTVWFGWRSEDSHWYVDNKGVEHYSVGTYPGSLSIRLVRDYVPSASRTNDAKELWEHCHKIFLKTNTITEMPNDLVEQKWIGDYGEEFSYNSTSYVTALARMYSILKWMFNSRTQIKVPWEVGRLWKVGMTITVQIPNYKNGAETTCVIESLSKTFYGQTPNVVADLIILAKDAGGEDDIDTIDESGDRVMIIDEAGDRDTDINETGRQNIRNLQ